MAVTCHIDPGKRRMVGLAAGTLDENDLFAFQQQSGALPDYDAILDGSAVEDLQDVNLFNLKRLAAVAAAMDVPGQPVKLAIVAPRDLFFGLGRMYESIREGNPRTSRKVGVFHTRAEAESWLDASPEE